MIELLNYPFFRQALIGVIIISIVSGIIGSYVVTRRMVFISGGITHACFGGLGLGYFLGINPILMAAIFAIVGSLGVEWFSEKRLLRKDSAIAVVWAVGMAVGVLFIGLTPGYVPDLNSFLFGDVLTITRSDIAIYSVFAVLLIGFLLLFFKEIVFTAFDADFARTRKVPVRFINYTMTIFVAIAIVLTIRMVGIMLLMSLLSLPQLIAEKYCRRFSSLIFLSVAISVIAAIAGLYSSYLFNVPASATIVLTLAVAFIVTRLIPTRN